MKVKSILSIVAIFFIALGVSSCQSKEESFVDKLNDIYEEINNADNLSSEEWDALINEFTALHDEAANYNFTEEQIKEIAKLETKIATAASKKAFGTALKSGGAILKGISEAFDDIKNESQDEVSDLMNDFEEKAEEFESETKEAMSELINDIEDIAEDLE